jgi:hypothetical protein
MAPGIPIIEFLSIGLLHRRSHVVRLAPESTAIGSLRKGDTKLTEGIAPEKRVRLDSAATRHWSKLTDDDIAEASGSPRKLSTVIAHRYGKPLREAEREVREWLARTGG